MTKASPDKAIDSLFSWPTAIVVVALLIGPTKIRSFLEKHLPRVRKVGPGGVELAQLEPVSKTPEPTPTPPIPQVSGTVKTNPPE